MDRKQRFLGCFETVKEAAVAYNIAAKKLFGEYAPRNDFGTPANLVAELRDDVLYTLGEFPG
jgi:hypothetical protein